MNCGYFVGINNIKLEGPGFTGKVSSFTVWGVIIACGFLCTLGWF